MQLCVLHGSQKKTAIISLHSINVYVFITEEECLLRGTNWVFKSDGYNFYILITNFCSLIIIYS